MHRLLVIAAVAALAAGCTSPCEELGDKICRCNPTGVSSETCKQQVSNVVDDTNPTKSQDSACSKYLDNCKAPDGIGFCEWLTSAEGKATCGLAY